MRAEKQRLSIITNKIKEKFPEENDIFGYSGITKKGIISSLEQTYSFLGLLDTIDDDIEKVWIKRKLAKYFDEIGNLIKCIDDDTWKDKFDNFLDIIFEMRINVKELYYALTNRPVRAEEDIQKAKDQYAELQNFCASITSELELIKSGSVETKELLEKLKTLKSDFTSSNEDAKKIIANIIGIEENANESNETIKDVTPKISATFIEIKELQKTLVADAERINTMSINCEKNVEKIKLREDVLQKQIETDKKIQEEIRQTLEDVNKHGMAGAFQKRKQELKMTTADKINSIGDKINLVRSFLDILN